jgi:hypothetical protein
MRLSSQTGYPRSARGSWAIWFGLERALRSSPRILIRARPSLKSFHQNLMFRTPRIVEVHRWHAVDGDERQGPSLHTGFVPAESAGAERGGADHLLHIAGSRSVGVREPATWPLRHGAGRWCDGESTAKGRLLLDGGFPRVDEPARVLRDRIGEIELRTSFLRGRCHRMLIPANISRM